MLQSHLIVEPTYNLNAVIDANVIILTTSTLSGNTNWHFAGASFASKIIKLSSSASSGTTVSGSGTPPSTATTFTDSGSSAGAVHLGSAATFGNFPDASSGTYPSKIVNVSNGAHTHVWTGGAGLTNAYPPYIDIGAYYANGTVTSLPANTIIFMDNQPSPDCMIISTRSASYEGKHFRIASTEASIGTIAGSTTFSSTYTAGSAGTHLHSYTSTSGSYTTDAAQRSNFTTAGSHSHTSGSISFTLQTYGIKLRTWVTTNSTKLAPGMMMLQRGTVTPTDWSVCDGAVHVGSSGRTYITPDLTTTPWYLKPTSTINHYKTEGTVNSLTATGSTSSFSWVHNHVALTKSTYNRVAYHAIDYDAAHSHTLPTLGGAYDPPATNFCMIMYTP